MIDLDIRTNLGVFRLDAQLTAPGGVTALFGHSGAGKTSIIRAVAGLLDPQDGHIRIGGETLFDADRGINLPPQKRGLGYVFQDGRLFPHMSVLQNLTYGGHSSQDAVIALLGLEPLLQRRPVGLSGGEKQRVAIGRALMAGPRLLLMDEPLAALDQPRKDEVLPYIARLRDTLDLPILYVSHAMPEIARLAQTIAVLKEGRVVQSGPLAEVLSDPALVPLLGVRDAGAVIEAMVAEYDPTDDLTLLHFAGGTLTMPGNVGVEGQRIRLRVPAQDVILALKRPVGLSALNLLDVTITSLEAGKGPGVAVGLRAGETRLLARVTRRSAAQMKLEPGLQVVAIIKATAVARSDIG